MQTIGQKVFRGAIWIGASRIFINAAGFASTIILARLLTPDDFGIIAIAFSILAIVAMVTEMSLQQALVHLPEVQPAHYDTAFTLGLIRSGLLAVLLAAAAKPLAYIFADERLTEILLAVAGGTLLTGLSNPKIAKLMRELVFWQEFAVRVSEKIGSLAVSIAAALWFGNYWAIIAGMIASQIITVIISYLVIAYRPRFSLFGWRDLMSFSIWLTFGQAINIINWKLDFLAIGYFLGTRPLGLYSVADNLASLPTREATLPIAQTLFPGFARLADDKPRLAAAYLRAQSVLCAITFPVGVGFALVADLAIMAVMGEKWIEAAPIVSVLAVTFALQVLSSGLQPLAMATGNTRMLFRRDVRSFLIRIPFIFAGMALGGLMGIVYGRFFASMIGTFWNMQLVKTITGIPARTQILHNHRTILATLTMVAAVLTMRMALGAPGSTSFELLLHLTGAAFTGAAAYFLTLFCLWAVLGRPSGPEHEAIAIIARMRTVQ